MLGVQSGLRPSRLQREAELATPLSPERRISSLGLALVTVELSGTECSTLPLPLQRRRLLRPRMSPTTTRGNCTLAVRHGSDNLAPARRLWQQTFVQCLGSTVALRSRSTPVRT